MTAPEMAVIRLLLEGKTVRATARLLGVEPSTVSMRWRRAADQLGARTFPQLVLACERRGLLAPDTQLAARVRREVADRHSSTCALLSPRVCDCGDVS